MGKPVLAMVTLPSFINGVLLQPGEVAEVDLEALGVKAIGDETPGLIPHKGPRPEPAPLTEVPSTEGQAAVELEVAEAAPVKPSKPSK